MNEINIIKAPSPKKKVTLRILIILGVLSIINFFYWFLKPELIDNKILYWMLMGPLLFDSFRLIYIWYHYWNISVPRKPVLTKNFSVDVFTTYFPGEPYEMVKETLRAIQRMKYPHTTYLCDEANDPQLIEFCKINGIVHVTRNNRINAKAGNINNALKQASGDICLILDPDHVPKENFLDEVVPYFEDEEIGFVQSVQAYYNIEESLVAKGSAEQTFHFYGPVMMTMNSYGTVNAIGANCVFRRAALDSIGGHAPGLSEDMHTAMQLYAKGWKSVYVPKIYTKGLVPSSITSYYKQQLKWSRGTLELLGSVFPKLFRKFTWRQKIHFGILPLHYLSGFTILLSFLIPVIALFTSTTPWKGNIINFGLIFLPILTSTMGIRFYVQQWVMDKSERGAHLLGGLLLACTWWIFIIGAMYTLIRKKVPYLPTPKEDTKITNWKILIPNIVVGLLSIIAVIYGLSADFTPFSIFMSGFALLNAFFMFFTVVLAYEKQKQVTVSLDFKKQKQSIINTIQNVAYAAWHKAALPVILIIFIVSGGFYYQKEHVKWGGVKPEIQEKNVINYIGIFTPQNDDGITSLENVKKVSAQIGENFDIVSLYIAWEKNIEASFPRAIIDSIYQNNAIPMVTWEPWLNSFSQEINDSAHVFSLIENGFFDSYILLFAEKLKKLEKPVFLRFAHEFDNPFYPWFVSGDNAVSQFKKAWTHVYEIFKNGNAHNVIWIWNPWQPENLSTFYPGKEYVDWVGINILNYGKLNRDGEWHDFETLYQPFHEQMKDLPPTPVIISEFGTLKDEGDQNQWIENAFSAMQDNFEEIKSVIYFDSKVDNNWPKGLQADSLLDWTIPGNQVIKTSLKNKEVPAYVFSPLPTLENNITKQANGFNLKEIKGINLKQNHDWKKNYHVLNRRKLSEDFNRIKSIGLNSIKFDGNSIYDYNILNISKEVNLNVSFGFWIPAHIDFMNDKKKTTQLKKKIINEVRKNRKHNHIISWNIQNDVLFNQQHFFHKPEILYQNRAYVIWLKNLVSEIKKIDPERPMTVDLEVSQLSVYHAQLLTQNVEGINYFGLIADNNEYLNSLISFLKKSQMKFLFSEIDTEDLVSCLHPDSIPLTSFFVTSWQDQHESNKLTFDGIIDRKGRTKTEYFTLLHSLQNADSITTKPTVRILKPAVLLYDHLTLEYYSMLYIDGEGWKYGLDFNDLSFEWALIKCDQYGNYLAIKDIDSGPVLRLRIPKNHEYFKLLLTVSDGKSVTETITTLNTPLKFD
ncbi:Glycosyltransferase, catalytic subunit of cellulose synthase and poly-beta-1,6-N-acetylglucosamine synthase [Mariniphaga anaerophila]|uniref:Glycosyltransferase, catalytic subunit of cellulose synthase and poly-beta-1,6-N-acetylglucosamine synthase n=1 Tax=Mariniphaga anaerophila TaxID=1484053 RepID=A0A1M5BNH7_9BACT|nr:glycosyltransferase family 2 protein [Mariniphaga anaerophila]SHF44031.1 Glycosyltransferase, catalytic subunit of cellulose synthase and poly-beta-1,6-N-acetylglucosamine synthase [Mariniphaga anaerophila]